MIMHLWRRRKNVVSSVGWDGLCLDYDAVAAAVVDDERSILPGYRTDVVVTPASVPGFSIVTHQDGTQEIWDSRGRIA